MQVNLNHDTNIQSNLYLRAFYAKLRSEYGKCAWYFTPWKDGQNNTIHLGFIDIGLSTTLEIAVEYEKKGVIKSLSVNGIVEDTVNEKLQKLAESINPEQELTEYFVSSKLYSSAGSFSNVISDSYSLFAVENDITELTIKLVAFDEVDAKVEAGRYIQKISNALSVFVNDFVKYRGIKSVKGLHDIEPGEEYMGDLDWVDDHPIQNKNLVLAAYQKQLLEQIQTGEIRSSYLRGCAHFNNAAYLLKDYSMNTEELTDTASVLYISALEACTELLNSDVSSCSSCGQKVFSIRRRVLELVKLYHPDHLVKFFDNYYANRSKYLHTGRASSVNNYYGTSIPLLDPDSESGCVQQVAILPLNLRDYISYIFRQVAMNQELIGQSVRTQQSCAGA